MASSFGSFIPHNPVLRARKLEPPEGELDSTSIAWRRGSCIERIEKRKGLNTMQVAGWVAKIIDTPSGSFSSNHRCAAPCQ